MIINLPHKLKARTYQQEAIDKFFKEKYRYMVLIWPRRHGKDRTAFNILIGEALRTVGLYFYAYPNRQQAKTAIWEGIMPDGTKFLDHIPKEALKSVNNTELKITLVNGSIVKLVGMDYYDNYVGTNPRGIVFSEYSVGNPIAYSLMRPILRENGGFAIFPYTPRGHTHGFDLYNINKDNPKWFCSFKTADTCLDEDGNRYLTEEDIEEERRSGMSENMIRQEFYCDFEATLEGAIFTLQINKAYEENRILDFPIDRTKPVYTFWDLGRSDPTCVWFMQVDDAGWFNMIYYYEGIDNAIPHHVKEIYKIREKLGITFGGHYVPHDIMHKSYQTNISHLEYARNLGINFRDVKRIATKEDGIERARSKFDKTRFHKTNCEDGINALKSYVRVKNSSTNQYGKPAHDWASHGCLRGNSKIKLKNSVKNIKDVVVGDVVDLNGVFGEVTNAGLVKKARTLKITLSNGSILECTKEHRIFTTGGIVFAGDLKHNDVLFTWEKPLCNLKLLEKTGIRKGFISYIKELNIGIGKKEACIAHRLVVNSNSYIERFGKIITEKFQKVSRYIQLILIRKTCAKETGKSGKETHKEVCRNINSKILDTINITKDKTGIIKTDKLENSCTALYGSFILERFLLAITFITKMVISPITIFLTLMLYLAQCIVLLVLKQTNGSEVKITKHSFVEPVKLHQKYVKVVNIETGSMCNVYDLTIKNHNCYFANGILVSNSDSFIVFSCVEVVGQPAYSTVINSRASAW